MNSTVVTTPLASLETPLLAVIVPSGNALSPALADLDRATGGTLGRAISTGDYKGKKDETALFYGTGPAQRVLLVGVGKAGEVSRSSLRRAAAVAGKRARGVGVPRFAIAVAPEARSNVPARDVGQVLAEGTSHGSWAFTEMKKPPEEPRVEVDSVTIVANAAEQKDVEAGRVVGARSPTEPGSPGGSRCSPATGARRRSWPTRPASWPRSTDTSSRRSTSRRSSAKAWARSWLWRRAPPRSQIGRASCR